MVILFLTPFLFRKNSRLKKNRCQIDYNQGCGKGRLGLGTLAISLSTPKVILYSNFHQNNTCNCFSWSNLIWCERVYYLVNLTHLRDRCLFLVADCIEIPLMELFPTCSPHGTACQRKLHLSDWEHSGSYSNIYCCSYCKSSQQEVNKRTVGAEDVFSETATSVIYKNQ